MATTPVADTTETVAPPILGVAGPHDPTIQGPGPDLVFDEIPQLERYRLVRVLGVGGMGQVWLAEDPVLSREVAIKLVAQHGRDRADRLAREARALARLSHPNVVSVFDVGTIGAPVQSVFIVMELVRGPTLTQWLESHRTVAEIVGVFVQAAAGLAAAHAAGPRASRLQAGERVRRRGRSRARR
jgi:serine/threonine protein kinase